VGELTLARGLMFPISEMEEESAVIILETLCVEAERLARLGVNERVLRTEDWRRLGAFAWKNPAIIFRFDRPKD